MQGPPPSNPPWGDGIDIPAPTSGNGPLIHWAKLKFNPVGVHHLRRWQGAFPQHPLFFLANKSRFAAADLAWFAAGTHSDGQHFLNPNSFHPMFVELQNTTQGSAKGRDERKALGDDMELLIWDLVSSHYYILYSP
jgi:hypothetical protein